ncbi:MAG TPA: glycosyl hydrolase [Chitinophagaceae bacterium]
MKRSTFIVQGTVIATGLHFKKLLPSTIGAVADDKSLYSHFKDPASIYRPFVRWWWNGDKIEKSEITRELGLLKNAGISGVEINPIKFPAKTNDLGKRSVQWLSEEWIELLQFTFEQAKSLDITCDLLVGSGWPLGGEWLEEEEHSQIVVIGTKTIEGPLTYETNLSELFKEADPAIYSPYKEKKLELLSVKLLPLIVKTAGDAKDISGKIDGEKFSCQIPRGKYVLYTLVKIKSFMQVIQGAPGATGPVLNHFNKQAVEKYLSHMSATIQQKLGPLSGRIRALFIDSLELEGANWCNDMPAEFKKRRGYDIDPWLPFLLYKIVAMGNTFVFEYGVEYGAEFKDMIQRVRYDFELTKAELLKERFLESFITWCKENKVQSRVQAYGRGYFPLESSFEADIPECETWLRPGLGLEMGETDYRIGRAYTMVNKYVSSAAHLKGKRHVSCEELTNIHMVFNESLELMKIASDQSIISGVTHSILHGFNYSPPDALFPGWVIYGSFINERNPWWNYFYYFIEYKARLSAILQQATMFADIAILTATADLWSIYGAQNDPFPVTMYPDWQTLIWEAIHKNGNGCDYVSEKVIQDCTAQNGFLNYGQRKYRTLFIIQVERMEPATAKKLFDFISSGGRVFCIESYPEKSYGLNNYLQNDEELKTWIDRLKNYPDQFIFLKKPEKDFLQWFRIIQEKYQITPYVNINSPNPFVSQVRYQAKEAEILVFINSSLNDSHEIVINLSDEIVSGKQPWLWDPETGERYRIVMDNKSIKLDMGRAELKLLVFDKGKNAPPPVNTVITSNKSIELKNTWSVTGNHIDGSTIKKEMKNLENLKDVPEWVNFCGNIVYKTKFELKEITHTERINLGKVYGVSVLTINGKNAGTKWYGQRIYQIGKFLNSGMNEIEIQLTTTMGNYMKTLKDNPIAQFWTNEGRTIQPLQPIGMPGPVTIF